MPEIEHKAFGEVPYYKGKKLDIEIRRGSDAYIILQQ
jgi:hypothetical protein